MMSRIALSCMLSLMLVFHSGEISGADQKPPQVDLSKFPKIKGKVVQALGSSFGYIPPRVGAEIDLDLKTVTQLNQLRFKPVPGIKAQWNRYSYIPLAISVKADGSGKSVSVVNPLKVEAVNTYTTGAFESMRLVSRTTSPDRHTVTLDVKGNEKNVQISVLVEWRHKFGGLFLIEGQGRRTVSRPNRAERSI